MKSKCSYIAITVVALVPIACTKSLHEADFAQAKPVEVWGGVKNGFQDGSIYFSGQPTAEAFRAAQADGIQVVVNLRSDREMKSLEFDEPSLIEELGMKYVALPVTPATFAPADADELKEILLSTTGPILIHCASSNRVGAIWAMYLHRHRGVGVDDAIDLGRKAGMRSEVLVETIRATAD